MDPKFIDGRPLVLTGPPFGMDPLAPDALMMTEGFRPCSVVLLVEVPFEAALAACGPPCAIALDPFTGDSVEGLALFDGAETPAGVEEDVEAVLVADA